MEDTSRTVLQAYKDARKVIEALFITLQEDTYVLIRIQALVALVTAMFLVMFIVDFYRCRSRSELLTTIFKGVDSLSDQIVVHLLGTMQSARFENQMFPVWAVVLVSLRASLGYLSGYGIPDRERRLTEVGNVIKFMGAGVLNGTRGLDFTKPLWSLWAILLLRSIYRFVAHDRAIRSLWHGRSSEFIPEYMRDHDRNSDHEQGNSSAGGGESSSSGGAADNNMAGDHGQRNNDNDQKYLVYGESNQEISLERPRYTLHLKVLDSRKLITLDKISGRTEPLLSSSRRYKDISVAFTLSRLLRCRLEDVTLHRESIVSTRKLITSNITDEQQMAAEAAVVAGEMVPAARETVAETSSVATAAAREIEMVPVATAVTASAVATATEEETAEMEAAKQKFRILELELAFVRDYFYTLYPMVFWSGLRSLSFSLLLSMATFAIAFWLAVDIHNVYYQAPVDNLMLQVHGGNIDVLITWVFMLFMMFKEVWEMVTYLLSNWTRLLLVCKYVQSQPWFRRYILKGGLISSFFDSKIIATSWHGKIDQYDFLTSCNYKPTFSKLANAMTLGKTTLKFHGRKSGEAIKIPDGVKPAILQALRRIGLNNAQLPKEIPSLTGEQFQRYQWACLDLHTCSEVILVWHIATSICEIKLAQEYDLTKQGFLQSAWSYLKNMCLCNSQPCLVDNNILQDGKLKENYLIANSLSRYCAYLQVFLSELLPDSFVVPELIFGETLQDAHKELKDCNLQQCRYNKLMVIAQETARNNVDRRLGMNIVQQGATLGKALIENEDEESRWKILAGVWADLLVHIAPSWNAADHKYTLESGGEFITLIWALLWHCGIEKSNLWNTDKVPENIVQAPQGNMTETSNRSMEKQPIHDGIESSQEPKTSNSLRGRESTNAQIHTENQTPIVSEANNGVSPSSFTN